MGNQESAHSDEFSLSRNREWIKTTGGTAINVQNVLYAHLRTCGCDEDRKVVLGLKDREGENHFKQYASTPMPVAKAKRFIEELTGDATNDDDDDDKPIKSVKKAKQMKMKQ